MYFDNLTRLNFIFVPRLEICRLLFFSFDVYILILLSTLVNHFYLIIRFDILGLTLTHNDVTTSSNTVENRNVQDFHLFEFDGTGNRRCVPNEVYSRIKLITYPINSFTIFSQDFYL